jgi:tryptophan halogenase
MTQAVSKVIVVGGGTAGWLTAARLAATFDTRGGNFSVTLIESPTLSTIGVGEGTWPSMRTTLLNIGISETEFMRYCFASPKQGTTFLGWVSGQKEQYHHPFSLPEAYTDLNLAEFLSDVDRYETFAHRVTPQATLIDEGFAPKQINTPDYAYTLNYGYHLDAGKFAELLRSHATERLGVDHLLADIIGVEQADTGDIAAVVLGDNRHISGDLFIDCSGMSALLIGRHLEVPYRSMKKYLFNDRALAVQEAYPTSDHPIAPTTRATAQSAGWVWDIGLQHRRGIGHVYASDFSSQSEATEVLRNYVQNPRSASGGSFEPRLIKFEPGYREKLWSQNCVAIGLSAGFVEPLEASALVLVELSVKALIDHFPADRTQMRRSADTFNNEFLHRWEQIIEFIKLHYVLSARDDSDYWRAHRDPATIPDSLQHKLDTWRLRPPWFQDETRTDEMFPSASYQYVLYGMGFVTQNQHPKRRNAETSRTKAALVQSEMDAKIHRYRQGLPSTRQLVEMVQTTGFRASQQKVSQV